MSKKNSILFINRVYPPEHGATGRVLRDLARAFSSKGWKVTVMSVMSSSNKALAVKSNQGVDYCPVITKANPRTLWGIFLMLRKIGKVGKKLPKHDLVVTMTDPPMLIMAGQKIARSMDAKHIHWCQDLYPDMAKALGIKLPRFFYKFCFVASRRAMKKCDRVITIGRCMARHLRRTGVDPARISVIPNWADLVLYRKPSEKNTMSRQENVSDKFKILYAGNMGQAHVSRTVLESAQSLARTNRAVEFVFAGRKESFEQLRVEKQSLGVDNIRFLPFQPLNKLQDLLKGADIHLVTMQESAQGLLVPCKFYSALAAARPCIFVGPEECEISIIIKDFDCGVVIPEDRPDLLSKAVQDYLEDADLWFRHQQGAFTAAQALKPSHSINAWITRAENTLKTF